MPPLSSRSRSPNPVRMGATTPPSTSSGSCSTSPSRVLQEGEVLALLCAADRVELLHRLGERRVDVGVGAVGEFADLGGRAEHVAIGGGALHHAGVVLGADGRGQLGDEVGDVGLAADLVDPAAAGQLGGDGDGIDDLTAVPEVERGDEEQAMARVDEVGRDEDRGDALEHAGFGEDRADDGAFGGDILRNGARSGAGRRLRLGGDHDCPLLGGGGRPRLRPLRPRWPRRRPLLQRLPPLPPRRPRRPLQRSRDRRSVRRARR